MFGLELKVRVMAEALQAAKIVDAEAFAALSSTSNEALIREGDIGAFNLRLYRVEDAAAEIEEVTAAPRAGDPKHVRGRLARRVRLPSHLSREGEALKGRRQTKRGSEKTKQDEIGWETGRCTARCSSAFVRWRRFANAFVCWQLRQILVFRPLASAFVHFRPLPAR